MRKLFSFTLVLLMVLLSFSTAFASSSLSASVSQSYVKQGDSFTVYAVLSTTETVDNLGISVAYDTSVLAYADADWVLPDVAVKNFDSILSYGVAQMNTAVKPNGNVFYITFRVRNDAPITETAVTFNLTVGSGGETVSASSSISINCNHSWGEWQVVSEATCTEIGQLERVCSICGSRQQSYVDAKGHSYSDWETTREATCTESGEQVRTCSVCGSTQARSIDPVGHVLGENATIIKEASCTEHGEASGTCTVCGQDVTVETAFAPHQFGDWYTIVQPTCTEKGEREHECSVCGYIERQRSLPLGHDFSQGTLVRSATISSTGIFEAVCSRCGTEGSIISPCSQTDEETGIYLETEEDVFPQGSTLKVKMIDEVRPEDKEVRTGITKYFYDVIDYFKLVYRVLTTKNSSEGDIQDYGLSKVSSSYNLYEIKAVNNDGDKVEQDGISKLEFPLPEKFGRNISVFNIDEDGKRTDLPVVIDMENKKVTVKTDKLNVFAVLNMDSAPEKDNLSAPAAVHYLIELLLLLFLILALIISGSRKKKLKALKNDNQSASVSETVEKKEEPIKETVEQKEIETAAADSTESVTRETVVPEETEDTAERVITPHMSSLRDEINEALSQSSGEAKPIEPKAEPEAVTEKTVEAEEVKPEVVKPRKPTLDEIFGETKK